MAMKDRETLKNSFKKGNIPSQAEFENLIDSGINKIDDGFSKSGKDGLMISSVGGTDNLLSFYNEIQDEKAQWVININNDEKDDKKLNDLQIGTPENAVPLLTLNKKGRVGINETNPKQELDVNGWIASKGRIGNYSTENKVPANGQWYAITPKLNFCQAFEVVARTGVKNSGKHAILHAVTVCAYGKSNSSIRKVRTWFDFWRPVKIQLRWTGETYSYQLEIRCKQNLGPGVDIKYYLTQLWSDEEMGIEKQFRDIDKTK